MLWEEMFLHHGYDAVPVVCIGMDRRGNVCLFIPSDMDNGRNIAEEMIIISAMEIASRKDT